MNDLDILKQVVNTLDNIEIPTKYVEKIGIPISNSSNLLKALVKAVEETIKKKQAEEQAPAIAEPVSEPVEEEAALEGEVLPVEEPAEN